MQHSKRNSKSQVSQEKLLSAAEQVFLSKGYQASIDDIAAEAGVVRQTLYNHFAGKYDIFAEVIRRVSRRTRVMLTDDSGDLRSTLVSFGKKLCSAFLADEAINLHRTILAEGQRFPLLAKAAHEGRQYVVAQLADLLARERAAGRIAVSDPEFAAESFITLVLEPGRTERMLVPDQHRKTVPRHVEQVVDFFLSAISARPAMHFPSSYPSDVGRYEAAVHSV